MIEGARVMLRRMTVDDTDTVLRLRSDVSVLTQLFSDAPPTREAHLRWLADVEAGGDRQEFVIVERARELVVGTIGLSGIDRRHRRAEYGVLVASSAQGKGFAAEASRLLLDHAFESLRLRRVYLHVFPENQPALHLYRRLGFEPEGLLRGHVFKGGQFRDVLVMAIVRSDRS